MNGDRNEADSVHVNTAGIHPCRGVVLLIEQRLERRIAATRLKTCGDANARHHALRPEFITLLDQSLIVGAGQNLLYHRVVVATVVMRPARDQIREFVAADKVAPAHLDGIQPHGRCDLVDRRFDSVVRRRLSKATDCFLRGLVRHGRHGAILDAFDLVGTDDRTDRLAELERRTPRIGTDIIECAHFHRLDDAIIVERDVHIEQALRPMGIACPHVLQPVLDQTNRTVQDTGKMRHQNGVLDAALDAVAAADIDIVMHAHIVGRDAQGAGNLVGIFRHLDRSPDIEHLAPRVPSRHDAEGFDRHRRIAAPLHAKRQMPGAFREMLLDLTPDECLVQQHIGAVLRMHIRAGIGDRLFRIDHVWQRLVFDAHFFRGVLSLSAGLGDNGHHPLTGITHLTDRERIAPHLRRI